MTKKNKRHGRYDWTKTLQGMPVPIEGTEYILRYLVSTDPDGPERCATTLAVFNGVEFEPVIPGHEGKLTLSFTLMGDVLYDNGKVRMSIPAPGLVRMHVWPEDYRGVKEVVPVS